MKVFLLIVFNLITLIVSAQQTFTDSVIAPLQKNQLFFEKVFIHTNKTSYFVDDTIWFKAYVGDLDNKPSLKTTRLSVNLLNSEGKTLQTKTVFINKGTGKGQFELNDSLKSGTYYIQAYTNYMRNFGDNNSYIQEINILNKIPEKENSVKNNYDIQLFPEGGYLLEDAENVIGIKSLINGKGFDYSGKIVNSKNQEIISFKNEYLGMTKCKFFYVPNENYTAIFTINDTIIKTAIPTAKKRGVVLNIDNTKADILSLVLKTNNNTLAELKKSNYTLLFHQRNRIIDFLEISDLGVLNTNLEFDKNSFCNGINTLTIFKGNQPIIERKFHIEKEVQAISLSLKKINIENDSINYKIKIAGTDINTPITTNLSVSVSPINALNFNETTNIKSSFLLSPYLKGYVENPAYYFNKNNNKKNEHLDLLLLTQGWIQYSSEDMIKSLNPSYKYDFELGFKLKGTVSPLLTNQLALITKDNMIIDKLYLNETKDFSFNNLLIFKGDAVKVSFINNSNEAIKPKNIYFDPVKTATIAHFNIEKKTAILTSKSLEDLYASNAIKLDEILIGKRKSESYYKRKKLINKYKPLVFDIGKYYSLQISDRYKNNNDNLMSFLRFDQNVTLANWKGVESYLKVGVNKEAILFIDGRRITSDELSGISLNINDVENIMAQPVKGNIIYQVFTTENHKKIGDFFNEYEFNDGFDKAKKYYSPIYDFNISTQLNWVEIDWKPDLTTNTIGETFIKIKQNKELEGYLFSIQGFSEEGLLISEILKEY
ncbi:MAG: hypothetical protein ABWZ56_02960 [Flavobacterium sp.]